MKHWINVVETIRVDTVDEALALCDEMSESGVYELETFQYTEKFDKKTEEDYVVVKVKKVINKEKEPVNSARVTIE